MATDSIAARSAATLATGAAGGGLFWLIGFPAPMLTGPAAAVSLVTLAGLNVHIPGPLRDVAFLILGVSIGSTVTPEVLAVKPAWAVSLVMLCLTLLAILALVRLMLIRLFGYDSLTALLAATPGHLSYILGLSSDLKADVPTIALVQSIRVLFLTLLVPVLIALWGVKGAAYLTQTGQIAWPTAAVVFALALALGLAFKRLHIPAPLLLGAMAVSAFGHGSGVAPGDLPPWMTMAAFVVMGSLIGTRFAGLDRRGLRAAILAGGAATVIACIVAAAGAVLAAAVTGLPAAVLLLAFAPGAVEVVAALAVATGLDPAFVAAHHVIRLILLSIFVPVLILRARRG